MKIKQFENISPKDPLIDEDTVITSCSNRLFQPLNPDLLFPMEMSHILPLPIDKCFMYTQKHVLHFK